MPGPLGLRQLGAYQLVAPLATGGMAELFVAKTAGVSGFEKQVALKVIHPNYSSDPEFVRMLVDEAKLAVQLQHANIVQTYDLGQVRGQYYIAMELIDGADLYKLLKTSSERGLDFPIDVAAFITAEVATGLDYAHRKNDPLGRPLQIVHRDVSPQNVLVSREGEVKIVDFGIAKAALRGQHTQAGVIKGKYFYMSPEQAMAEKIDARTDVFSTGILLHEMLVGEMLYLEEDMEKLLKMVRAADISPPSRKRPDVPADLDAIVMKALAKKPADRFQTGADLATALTRFLRMRYPESGRAGVARFAREVLEREQSRAEITLPPADREDFGDENSLIFNLQDVQAPPGQPEHSELPTDLHQKSARRQREEKTRGIESPAARAPARSDFEDGGATEFDGGQQAIHASEPVGFDSMSEDGEPTEFVGREDFSGTDDEFTEAETHALNAPPHRATPARPAPTPPPRRNVPPPVRERRASIPPPPRTPTPANALPTRDLGPVLDGLTINDAPPSAPAAAPVDWSSGSTFARPSATPAPAAVVPYERESAGFAPVPKLKEVRRTSRAAKVMLALVALSVVVGAAILLWPAPSRGTGEIVSVPKGATVRVDDTVLPRLTPLSISNLDVLQPHHVIMTLRGYDTWESDLKFGDERNVRMQAVLVPTVGTLDVSSVPQGADAIVNGRMGGVTPTTIGDLPPNEDVTLELRLRGYKVAQRTLSWDGKRALSIVVPLEKAR